MSLIGTRKLSDMRRSGGVEDDAGGASVEDQANTVDRNARLHQTYSPVNVASVRRFDQARTVGAKLLEQNETKGVSASGMEILLGNRKPGKSLKKLARETGLEPAASAVTGRRSNQLSYSRGCRNQLVIRAGPRA
jgi:hypothetical protein